MKWSKYDKKARRKIKHLDLFFTASPALGSKVIRFATQSKVSHVGAFIRIGGRVMCVESLEPHGVRIIPASNRFKKEDFVHVPMHVKDQEGTERRLWKRIGEKYDLLGAIFAPWFDIKNERTFCSELISKAYKMNFRAHKNGVVPRDVYNYAVNNRKR